MSATVILWNIIGTAIFISLIVSVCIGFGIISTILKLVLLFMVESLGHFLPQIVNMDKAFSIFSVLKYRDAIKSFLQLVLVG